MMTSKEIRKAFLDFFAKKNHKIVPSAPLVIKDDPTLMFTNAGMNQFKDIFLGLKEPEFRRVADTQKCLRVSGKHNDLEEVGRDTYHHTMFEMLGNWSFGDYFKKEAIDYAWEFLTKVMHLDPDRLYATVFEGDKEHGLEPDNEARELWKRYLPEDHILWGNKKDNFWEMGDIGPCGPSSEIHVDMRPDEARADIAGSELVNKDHPEVFELWNLVFMQYNRKKDGTLEPLPQRHVDTGMGFERLTMVVQGKTSNYDTDIFAPIIRDIEKLTGYKYKQDPQIDIAMRVVADHIRAIAFSIADGQLPSNEGAGYVIRRILRRAVRYAYTFLDQKQPFLFKLLPALVESMGDAFPELEKNFELIKRVIIEEEQAFLHTLEVGIRLLSTVIDELKRKREKTIPGKIAFLLYDSYGFPLDLTQLIAREYDLDVDTKEFNEYMKQQKARSRAASKMEAGDWIILREDDVEEFVGYDRLEAEVVITRYRKAKIKGKEIYQLVFQLTPFYAESGGQVGDTGYIENENERIEIIDTQKEHGLIIHFAKKLPKDLEAKFRAVVDSRKRQLTANNHSATHLLHYALREILGKHVEQRGSYVDYKRLRFDFSHFQKVTDDELEKIEALVNHLIRQNYKREEYRNVPLDEAIKMGAMALFGEKYGDTVRVIKFGPSIELCGGTHVDATGNIGFFKIVSESAVAAGIRRIEAITALEAEKYVRDLDNTMKTLKTLLKSPKSITQSVEKLIEQNKVLNKQIEQLLQEKATMLKNALKNEIKQTNGINIISKIIDVPSVDTMKTIAYQLKNEIDNNLFLVLGAKIGEKANLAIMISNDLVEKGLNAGQIIREAAKEIKGGGGGQPFFATAGGKNPAGLQKALDKAIEIALGKLS